MKIHLSLILILTMCGTLFSQPYTNIMVSSTNSPEEVSICINPKNLNRIVAGANIRSFYYSSNSGYNWASGLLSSSYTVWGDDCIICDTLGNFYYWHLTDWGTNLDKIVCQKSTDGGMTWSNGTYTISNQPKMQDKEWACVDWTHGPRGNWIYVTWTQFDDYGTTNPADSSNILFSRSTDGGLTWSQWIRINKMGGDCWDGDNTVEGAVPAVGPNGEVYVAWAGPLVRNTQLGIFFDKSTDGGNTWLANDIYICNQRGGWDLGGGSSTGYGIKGIQRANGLPVTVCDISNGPYRGNIYVNYVDSVAPNDRDVMLVKSSNGGLNWSSPIRVNNDAPGKEQFFTWMTVDQTTGYLYFVFYDRRNYTYPDYSTDVYMARSTDGGSTFTNFVVSATPFIPNYNVFFGDYIGITAAHGVVRPFWMRLSSGNLSVWTAIVDFPVAVENENNSVPVSYTLSQNFPNPFNPSTTIKFTVPEFGSTPNHMKLIVYDALGKEVASLVNERLEAGTYQIEWNASNQPSGVYFYRLTAGDGSFIQTKKMILVK
jgi:hypothetical protein